MNEFRKGDIVRIVDRGNSYGTYYKAFKHFNFKNPDKSHYSYDAKDKLEGKFRVLGTFLHEYEKKYIMGIECGNVQLVVGEKGLVLLHRGELNKLIKIL